MTDQNNWDSESIGPEIAELNKLFTNRPLSSNKPRQTILIYSPRDWKSHVIWDLTIGLALKERDCGVHVLTCGGGLPICLLGWGEENSQPCRRCANYTEKANNAAQMDFSKLRDFLSEDDFTNTQKIVDALKSHDDLFNFQWNQMPISEIVKPSLIWIQRDGNIREDETTINRHRDLILSAIRIGLYAERAMNSVKPDVVLLLNGVLFEERVIFEVAKSQNRRVIFYECGRDKNVLFFSHDNFACRYDLSEHWPKFKNQELTKKEDTALQNWLDDREKGSGIRQDYWKDTPLLKDSDSIRKQFDIKKDEEVFVLFSNVTWDTAILDRASCFTSVFDWITETILIFKETPDKKLIIRVHPAETRVAGEEAKDNVISHLERTFTTLPQNVIVVGPDDPVSSYTLMNIAKAGIVYCSTIGLEMASRGIPVITAANADYADKGFTFDSSTKESYAQTLHDFFGNSGISEEHIKLARQYAYLLIFRASFLFDLVDANDAHAPRLNFKTTSDLGEGKHPELDTICSGIISETPFLREV